MSEKVDETFGMDACNIRVQQLQHVQHHDLFCNIHMKHLQHTYETSETIKIYSCTHVLSM
jgi:hypothetical protein